MAWVNLYFSYRTLSVCGFHLLSQTLFNFYMGSSRNNILSMRFWRTGQSSLYDCTIIMHYFNVTSNLNTPFWRFKILVPFSLTWFIENTVFYLSVRRLMWKLLLKWNWVAINLWQNPRKKRRFDLLWYSIRIFVYKFSENWHGFRSWISGWRPRKCPKNNLWISLNY
jgi:hypothetical protein